MPKILAFAPIGRVERLLLRGLSGDKTRAPGVLARRLGATWTQAFAKWIVLQSIRWSQKCGTNSSQDSDC
jgi:hypothetical protein